METPCAFAAAAAIVVVDFCDFFGDEIVGGRFHTHAAG